MFRQIVFRWTSVFGITLIVLCLATPSPAATAEQVEKAIERAQAWLIQNRNPEGVWEEAMRPKTGTDAETRTSYKGGEWGGLTSIATYALLASGKDPRDKDIQPAIHFLLNANIRSTYGLGLSSQIALYLPPKETRFLVKRDTELLLHGIVEPPAGMLHRPNDWSDGVGFYGYWTGVPEGSSDPRATLDPRSYGTHQPGGWTDRSNSQYGVLGMWALARAGGEVPTAYWELVDTAWKKAQFPDGSWDYRAHGEFPPGVSMTAAGVATLFITQDYTLNENWSVCRGGVKNPYIERGLKWMDAHIKDALGGSLYNMYGIERIGAASGRKFFGSTDWYQIGADYLVKTQKPDGSWVADHGAIPDTSFGLLFLARGRAPVIMNKLEYASDKAPRSMADIWNERPRDVANLAQWVGEQQETYFNWQSVNLQAAADELHDSPILYVSGSQPLDFKPDEINKLRQFVQQGGIIFGNADCGKREFADSFQKLGKTLFPKYEFHSVGAGDLLWKEQFTQFRPKPKVMELTNEVRKLMVLVPDADPSRAWQTRSDRTKESMYAFGANLFLYAVDKKNSLKKDQTYIVRPDPAVHPKTTIKVARLNVGDNPDPEPGGWPRLAAVMHNQFNIDLKVDLVKPDALTGYQIADLTGTGALQLSAVARVTLKQFVGHGGTLIIDAAGGNGAFADAAQAELANVFGPGGLKPLPIDSPIYNQPDGKPIKIVWRPFAFDHIADKRRGHIEGITIGKRIAVFFSREDLSAGLVGEPVDGIIGYEPQTATEIMAAIVRYAAGAVQK